jgi:hypothetical protein
MHMPTVHRLSFYRNVLEHNPFRNTVRMAPRVCVGPIRYVGHDKLRRDIENLKTVMVAAGADEGFMPAIGADHGVAERLLRDGRGIYHGLR